MLQFENLDLTGKIVNRVGSSSVNLPVDSKTVILNKIN